MEESNDLAPIISQYLKKNRVILHIDLDAFYCQVEHVRLNIPIDTPLCVQQWQGLIAVNYAARKVGIKRHCTASEALSKCPNVKLIHVATYANGEIEPQYHPNPHHSTHKVSLEPYRRASMKIFKIFQRFSPNVQRASIDEAYIDVTDAVNKKILESPPMPPYDDHGPDVYWDSSSIIVGKPTIPDHQDQDQKSLEQENKETYRTKGWGDLQLQIGAQISQQIRDAIFTELGYTCSTGISHNKTLSKLCSAMNKPNKQTVIVLSATMNFMKDLPFQKIRSLGGKLGDEIETELQVTTAGDLWKYSLDFLMKRFGEGTGLWLYNITRGICREEVFSRNIAKSMMAAKSFRPPFRTLDQGLHWIRILSAELYTRLHDDYEINSRWPKTLVLHFSTPNESVTKSTTVPSRLAMTSPDILVNRAIDLFRSEAKYPVIRMSLSTGGFQKDGGEKPITNFFQSVSTQSSGTDTGISHVIPIKDHLGTDVKIDNNKIEKEIAGIDKLQEDRVQEKEEELVEGVDEDVKVNHDFVSTFLCDQCQKSISIEEIDIHSDWHAAMKIYEQDRQTIRQRQSSPSTILNDNTNTTLNSHSNSNSKSKSKSNSEGTRGTKRKANNNNSNSTSESVNQPKSIPTSIKLTHFFNRTPPNSN